MNTQFSGSPLATKGPYPTLIGVANMGQNRGCEDGKPQSFQRVTLFLQWIHDKTKIEIN